MNFTSYAQNFEDVILWRALKHVENGFYIDIGAQDPVVDSVSLAFYEHGWRGLHVEPVPSYAERLRSARPDETVIQSAIGEAGIFRLFEVVGTGLSTGDPGIAKEHRDSGVEVQEVEVPCVTLASLLDRNADRDIHWLKIDVEGMEAQVLDSWRPSQVRPWVVVVEATAPNRQVETHKHWERFLTELGYEHTYFDGLNRFYVARKHRELKEAFKYGPSVFDGFSLNRTSPFCYTLSSRLDVCEQEASEARRELEEALTQSRDLERLEIERLGHEIEKREREIQQGKKEAIRLHELVDARERDIQDTQTQLEENREEIYRLTDLLIWHKQEVDTTRAQLQLSQGEAQSLAYTLGQREEEIRELTLRSAENTSRLSEELSAVYASNSWRTTKPLRFAGSLVKRGRALHPLRVAARRVTRGAFEALIGLLRSHPRAKAFCVRTVDRWPSLARHFRRMAAGHPRQAPAWEEPTSIPSGVHLQSYPASVRREYGYILRVRATLNRRKEPGEV